MKSNNKTGRPKKTTKDLPNNWKEMILEKMSEGASQEELVLELEISNDLFWRLKKEDKEFSETIKRGMELCKAWWMRQGRVNLKDKSFSPTLWYMNMKNRFQWKDRTDVTSDDKPLPTPIYGGRAKDTV